MTSTTLRRYKDQGIAYHSAGSGQPLVLLHGVGLRAESWHKQLQALSKQFHLYVLDLPGHGQSQPINANRQATKDYSINDYAEIIANFIATRIKARVGLCGHSMGAGIALAIASKHPDMINRLAAISAIYQREPLAKTRVILRAQQIAENGCNDALAAPLVRWFPNSKNKKELEARDLCQTWLLKNNIDQYALAYKAFAIHDGPTQDDFKQLDMPALFLTGESDPNSTTVMAINMAAQALQGQHKTITGARHMLMLTHAETLNQELAKFFTASFPN